MLSDEQLDHYERTGQYPAGMMAAEFRKRIVAQAKAANALQKHAERYQWFRQRTSLIDWDNWIRRIPSDEIISAEVLDSEIDAAIQAEKESAK